MSASSRWSSWPATSAASTPHPTKEAIDAITALADETSEMRCADARDSTLSSSRLYPLRRRPSSSPRTTLASCCSSASSARPIGTPAYQHATYVRPIGAAFTPAMPLSVGHITMLIAGQETGVLDTAIRGWLYPGQGHVPQGGGCLCQRLHQRQRPVHPHQRHRAGEACGHHHHCPHQMASWRCSSPLKKWATSSPSMPTRSPMPS